MGRRGYWRRVLAYAIEGGLSDVLDEYFHVISESHGGATDAAALGAALSETLHVGAGRLEVAEWKAGDTGVYRQAYSMRQHFARRYASDRAGTLDEQASERLDAVRRSFNSPFWPFVLATTSVGQEGLDFHWYCHAVVWTGTYLQIQWTWNNGKAGSIGTMATPFAKTSRSRWGTK